MMANGMRGLTNFIAEIRACPNKEAEKKRVDKELAHIRERFLKDSTMKGYDCKKYVSKLIYITMLGYSFDFGHIQAVNLLTSLKYSEKQIGYLSVAILLNEEHELTPLIINSILKDLVSKNELWICIALATVANIGGREMATTLHQTIEQLLEANRRPSIRKRALLATLRLFRKYPEILDPSSWQDKVIAMLEERDLGVVLAASCLLQGLIKTNGIDEYGPVVPRLIKLLAKIVVHRQCPKDYEYYSVPAPWVQVRALQLLQSFPASDDPAQVSALREVLARILSASSTDTVKNTSRNNAVYAILFEAINVIVHVRDTDLMKQAATLLGRFITSREPNVKYLGLESFARLIGNIDDASELVSRHERTIFECLRNPDISIRREALNMIYNMCSRANAQQVVSELLEYLPQADFQIREELVIKIAILAEKFAQDLSWYVNIALTLINEGGEFVAEDVWWRVVQIVTNNPDLHHYAARTVFDALQPVSASEIMIKIGAYILGEFGGSIDGTDGTSTLNQFALLHSRFGTVSEPTKALMLSAYGKMAHRSPQARTRINEVLAEFSSNVNAESQQRAVELLGLQRASAAVVDTVLDHMPQYPERESSLERMIRSRQKGEQGTAAAAHDGDDAPATVTLDASAAAASAASAQPRGARSGSYNDGSAAHAPPAAAAAAAHHGGGGDLLSDLMGGFTAPAASNSAAAPSRSAPPPSADDLLGGFTPSASVAAAEFPASSGIDVLSTLTGSSGAIVNNEFFEQLCIANEGVLYEDQFMQFMVKMDFHSNQGRVMVQLRNKSAQMFSEIKAFVQGNAMLRVQNTPFTPPIVNPGQTSMMTVSTECMAPFRDAPTLGFTCQAGGRAAALQLRFPIVVNKFVDPLRTQQADFFRRWNQVQAGSEQEYTQILEPASPIDPARLGAVLSGARFAVLEGVDTNPANFVGAGMSMMTNSQGNLLVRLEVNMQRQKLRLTVRCPSSQVAQIVGDFLKPYLTK